MTRILVATDAWHPQVNGVVRTLTMMAEAANFRPVEPEGEVAEFVAEGPHFAAWSFGSD